MWLVLGRRTSRATFPEATSHHVTLLSRPALTRVLPSGAKQAALIEASPRSGAVPRRATAPAGRGSPRRSFFTVSCAASGSAASTRTARQSDGRGDMATPPAGRWVVAADLQ